jgi:hypothetical protein
MKLADQVQFMLLNRVHIGVGTPHRIHALMRHFEEENGHSKHFHRKYGRGLNM